jgi:hypothetical protein
MAFEQILLGILIRFIASLILGFALLKNYQLFKKGSQENNTKKIWWSFASSIFLLLILLFIFG